MSRESSDFELSQFDEASPLTIDPAVYARNLAALSSDQPTLSSQLQSAVLPVTWRPVLALDDWPTWRCESPGEPASWLCDTAVPRTRADALLSIYQPGELNATLPAIACGAELMLLLERLPHHKAVYVFERDIAALSAVLRVIDVSGDIAAGRCILLHSDDPTDALNAVLHRWPALLPPGNILLLPGLGEESVAGLRGIVEKFAPQRLKEQNQRLEELIHSAAPLRASADERLGLFCGLPQRGAIAVLDAIEHAARIVGARGVSSFAVRGPRDVHPLAAAKWLAESRPAVTFCIGHRAALLPGNAAGNICEWLWKVEDADIPPSAEHVRCFAASEAIAERLSPLRGADSSQPVELLLFAADERLDTGTAGRDAMRPIDSICLVADRPLDDEKSLERMQPTHQVLWKFLRDAVREAWRSAIVMNGDDLLRSAEHATGLQIGDESTRLLFIDAIDRVLIPAVICETAIQFARNLSLRVRAVGGGWNEADDVEHLGDDIVTAHDEIRRIQAMDSRVLAIFPMQADAWPAALLNFLIAGIPATAYADERFLRCAAARGIRVGQDLRSYSGLREMQEVLRSAVQNTSELRQIIESGQQFVRTKHTWRNRLEAVLSRF